MKKVLFTVAVVFLLAVSCEKTKSPNPPVVEKLDSSENKSSSKSSVDLRLDWQSLNFPKRDFEFWYPKEWSLNSENSNYSQIEIATVSKNKYIKNLNLPPEDASAITYYSSTCLGSCKEREEVKTFDLGKSKKEGVIVYRSPAKSASGGATVSNHQFILFFWKDDPKALEYREVFEQVIKRNQLGIQNSTQNLDLSEWKTYKNTEYNFELNYPSDYVTTGKMSTNSTLGDVNLKMPGIFIGPFVFVPLKTERLKKEAKKYLAYNCESKNISDNINYVYCTEEGGPSYYAYITGTNVDIFVDGYSCGWDYINCADVYGNGPGRFAKKEDLEKILSTFKFTK